MRTSSPGTAGSQIQSQSSAPQSVYGSFDKAARTVQGASGIPAQNTFEDPEIVRRHLIQPETQGDVASILSQPASFRAGSPTGKTKQTRFDVAPGLDDDEFSSLRLQGGDTTRPIYKWAEERNRIQRSQSFHISRPEAENDALDIGSIKMPGGFRRNFLRRNAEAVADVAIEENGSSRHPKLLTK